VCLVSRVKGGVPGGRDPRFSSLFLYLREALAPASDLRGFSSGGASNLIQVEALEAGCAEAGVLKRSDEGGVLKRE
jgi:hypothetical protein